VTKLRNSDTAIVDRVAAVKSIQAYFKEIHSPELGRQHATMFREEMKARLPQQQSFCPKL
jgi:hypothetical protein